MKTLALLLILALPTFAAEQKVASPLSSDEKIAALTSRIEDLETQLSTLRGQVEENQKQVEFWIDELHDKIRHTAPVTPGWHQ